MRTFVAISGVLLSLIAAGPLACAGEDQDKPADARKEESTVAYDNKTHGALQVKSVATEPVDWFDVLQNGKRAVAGNPKLLNNTVELTPGTYVVDVNRSQRQVTIEAGKKTILWTGDLVVEGQPTTAFWYPMQNKERKLASNPPLLNRPRALFAGAYTVYVQVSVTMKDKNLGDASVKPGQKTVLRH